MTLFPNSALISATDGAARIVLPTYAAAWFKPTSVELLHQTWTFEGRSTNWASAPWPSIIGLHFRRHNRKIQSWLSIVSLDPVFRLFKKKVSPQNFGEKSSRRESSSPSKLVSRDPKILSHLFRKKVFHFVVVLADLIKDRRCHFSLFCGMRTSPTIWAGFSPMVSPNLYYK